ncbi:MEDS domain-containing protein [Halanaerobacter jeridensis]|uniref:histidine kinase n=1 Tax=Halanaerobacter jeridensis TaxID=706427 RepID=A0A938XTA9_9FIRM|nr:MEDS domain-containing protein [Halanaerobacter jeridensis]MBM7557444.1 signal transduction histidine kinase [Halanaerobacter jeridensis]
MTKVTSNFDEIKPQDHLCLLYEGHEEWKSAVTDFLKTGLRQNHRCLYISGAYSTTKVKKYLIEAGVAVENKIESEQLILLDKEDSYAQNKEFIPDKMIDFLKKEANRAIADGYDSLRVTGEISWALNYERGKEKIIEYEFKLNQKLFPDYPVIALCRYNLNKFTPEMIKNVIKVHPYIVLNEQVQSNPYYIEPQKFNSQQEEVEQWIENISSFTKLKGRFRTSIKRSQNQLEEKNRKLEQLLYSTSHDLRSPLLNIKGFSEEIKHDFEVVKRLINNQTNNEDKLNYYLEESLPEDIDYILKSVKRMDDLLKELLKLSRITVKDLDKELVNTNQLIQSIKDNFAYQLEEKNVNLTVDQLPDCYGDKKQLKRVFSNLLDNAIKYLNQSGENRIEIKGWNLDKRVVYAVADNGIGIVASEQEEIFDIFTRVTNQASVSGEGIGLALIKEIIDLHQGKIWLESKEKVGSIFFFAIPKLNFWQN